LEEADMKTLEPAAPQILTVAETAKLLRKGRNAIYEAVASGELPALRIGRTIRIDRRVVDRLLEGKGGDA
jgi:excisionase family DNA binding protein